MKNYLQRKNNQDNFGLGFWDFNDPFEAFFNQPFFNHRSNDLMRTDVKENEKDYELCIDMPGFDKKDIQLKLENGYVTVSAKKEEKTEEKNNYVRRERSAYCSRSYYVGDNLTAQEIKAKYENGTLELIIPKKEEKQIESNNISIE